MFFVENFKFVFGPVPSRRMGLSLGISPVPHKYCNYACVYCQLGRTDHMSNERREFFAVPDILAEVKAYLDKGVKFDVLTIVGDGEPALYAKLGELIQGVKKLTFKPVAVITNGALLSKREVRYQHGQADIVLPSLDAYDEESFKKINRPLGTIRFREVYEGLKAFSREYQGELWLEVMIIRGLNDDFESLVKLKALLKDLRYSRLYINTPVRPPAEDWVKPPSPDALQLAAQILEGISMESLSPEGFYSQIEDDYEAVLSIIKRHPMNQHELVSFLQSRKCKNIEEIMDKLEYNDEVNKVIYKGYKTYRLI